MGLSQKQIEAIIDKELDKNADLLVGIDDPEVQEMIEVLKKAVAIAISENNEQIEEDVVALIEKSKKKDTRFGGLS